MTLPLLSVFVLAVIAVLTGDIKYADAAQAGVTAVTQLLPNFNEILEVVVYAAVSIRAIKGFTR